eukprot:3646252-Rhodomonas_salina.1
MNRQASARQRPRCAPLPDKPAQDSRGNACATLLSLTTLDALADQRAFQRRSTCVPTAINVRSNVDQRAFQRRSTCVPTAIN